MTKLLTKDNILTEKRAAFCQEYTIDFNGSAAAIRAGYAKKSARVAASRMLDDKEVQECIAGIIEARNKKIELSAQSVIDELQVIAFSKTTDFVKVKDIIVGRGKRRKKIRAAYIELTDDIDERKQKAIAEISQTKDGIRLKQHDKVRALELLGKHLGVFEKDNKQKTPIVQVANKITHNLIVKRCDK
jgi:phage terminase small subunit